MRPRLLPHLLVCLIPCVSGFFPSTAKKVPVELSHMSFVYLKLSDARSSRTLELPRVGVTITFGVSVDAASGESFVQYPALSASEVARLGGGAATIKAQRDSTGGGAVLSFTGPRPAVSNGTLLSPNVPYAFDENESFTFYGTIGSILTGGTLRGRGDIGDGRQVVVMATGFIKSNNRLTLNRLLKIL